MALNSWQFLLLASIAVLVIPQARSLLQVALFLGVNGVFAYSLWGPEKALLAVGFCLTGYTFARIVRGHGALALVLSVLVLTASFVWLRGYRLDVWTGAESSAAAQSLAFVGLSFMFFKIVHVVVDSSSGSIERLSLGHYLNYSLNFLTVMMGPIQRYQDYAAQWDTKVAPDFEGSVDAVNRVLRGLLKAFVLAPAVGPFVLSPGVPIESLSAANLLLKTYAFYIYLYLEFAGYCDIVIGIGNLMGLRLPENFDFPFLSRNVSDYWLRVHRSLTLWLTDYIFTPAYRWGLHTRALGARAFLALSLSLVLTMLVAGVWHGTTLNFVVFGLVHGGALVLVRAYEQVMVRSLGRAKFRRFEQSPYVKVAAIFLTYNFTSLAYVFFVLNLRDGLRLLTRLAGAATGWVT